jgi:hypothetical protein
MAAVVPNPIERPMNRTPLRCNWSRVATAVMVAIASPVASAQPQSSPTQQPTGPGAPMQSPVAPASASPFNSTSSSSSAGSPLVTAPGLAGPNTVLSAPGQAAQPLGPAGAEAPATPLLEAAPPVRRAIRRDETDSERRDRLNRATSGTTTPATR